MPVLSAFHCQSLVSPNLAAAEQFHASFSGFQAVGSLTGLTGAIPSTGRADLHLYLDETGQTLAYTLTFSSLVAPVTQAHIHFGKHHVPGGIIVWLCGTAVAPGPAGTPSCPTNGTVTRTIVPGNVVGPTGQGIAVGDFAGLVAALESDTAYGNIHSTLHPAGEIRGQIQRIFDDNGLYNLPGIGNGR